MARSEDTLIIMAVLGAVLVGYYYFTKKGGVLDTAARAGAGAGEILNPYARVVNVDATTIRGLLQGSGQPFIPPTPAGYNESNWSWTLADGTILGLPAGMTPKEFCAQTPGAPICAQVLGG